MSDEVIAFFCGLAIGAISIATFDDLWMTPTEKIKSGKVFMVHGNKETYQCKMIQRLKVDD